MKLCLLKEAEAPCRSEGCAYQSQEEGKVQPAAKHCATNAGNKHHIMTQQHLLNSECILNMILGKELQLLKRFCYNMQFYSLTPKDQGLNSFAVYV